MRNEYKPFLSIGNAVMLFRSGSTKRRRQAIIEEPNVNIFIRDRFLEVPALFLRSSSLLQVRSSVS